uniref:Uncharacterized protein n=1 Tax=Arundo donax TaxID=35708 RepID=A0A0A9CRN4_ARUDO
MLRPMLQPSQQQDLNKRGTRPLGVGSRCPLASSNNNDHWVESNQVMLHHSPPAQRHDQCYQQWN